MQLKSVFALSTLALSLAVSACGEGEGDSAKIPVTVSDFEVRLNPAPGRPAAGYGLVKGAAGLGIKGAFSPEAGRIEMHIMEKSGEGMRMKKVDLLTIDSDNTLRFEPGGRHLMIFDIADGATDDGQLQINLSLDDNTTLSLFAEVN
ncbi:MAG: copper chaperone PCu(A)C [Pseudomonadota bacterium]